MTITQSIDIPADRCITVPREVPEGRTIIAFTPVSEDSHPCPICAKFCDPVTGEPLYNAETRAAIQEVDDMLAGKIPDTLKRFNSLEEMFADLDSDD